MHSHENLTHEHHIHHSNADQKDTDRVSTVMGNENICELAQPVVSFVQPVRKPNMAAGHGCLTVVKVLGKVIGCMNKRVPSGYAVTPTFV